MLETTAVYYLYLALTEIKLPLRGVLCKMQQYISSADSNSERNLGCKN